MFDCRSYNQGVILGGLSELYKATKDISYTTTAKRIADAGIKKLTDSNGILHDPCEPNCGGDGSQFKGVFARNLQILQQTSPESRYAEFLDRNADSVWQADRNDQNEFGLNWDGPYVGPANASTQGSALDAIVGALST
jgi:predicted alpha-1,6-mannanase (GH76 family)